MSRLLTTEEFIERSTKIHNNYYDYSLVNYTDWDGLVKIICPKHNIFEQRAGKHLHKRGCPKCALDRASERYRLPMSIFLERCKKKHGDRYNYSLVKYKNLHDYVSIICPIHGEFKQEAVFHLRGGGCPICLESKGEREIRLILERYDIDFELQYRFDDCRDKNPLPFDFYLSGDILIEYDGIQHFKSNKRFGGEKGLKDRKKKDKIKNEYCKNNKLKLYRIKYNENIENKILKIINENFLC